MQIFNMDWLRNTSRKKSLSDMSGKSKLNRCLTTTDLTVLGVGGMVGSGLYVLTGVVAKNTTGPAIIISYIIAAIVSLLSAVCYAEFGCRIPKTGSAYTYIYVSVGEIWAFIIGWNLILEYVVSASSVARAWSGYFDHLIGDKISNFTIEHLLGGQTWDAAFIADYPDIFGAVVLYIVLLFVAFGANISAFATAIMLLVNVIVVLFVFVVGLYYSDIDNWTDYGGFSPNGAGGIIAGAATLFYAYVGFDVIAIAGGEEALDQSKSIPRASFISIAGATAMYLAASIALTLMIPYTEIQESSALASAFAVHGANWAQYIIGIGALCGMFTALLGSLFCLPRSVYAMACDGILFEAFAHVNQRTQVPVLGCLVFGTISAVLCVVFDIEALVEFLSIGVLMAYAIVSAALIRVRYTPLGAPLYTLSIDDSGTTDSRPSEPSNSTPDIPAEERNGQLSTKTTAPIPGTLKDKYRQRFPYLTQFEPGHVVCISLISSIVFQFIAVLIATTCIGQLASGTWWSWLLVALFGLLGLVCFLLILMHNEVEIKDGFKVPLCPYLPAISVLCNIVLMLQLSFVTWIRFIIWVAVGLLIYLFYGYRHSKMRLTTNAANASSGGYEVLRSDKSSEEFTGALYGTIVMQQPESDAEKTNGDEPQSESRFSDESLPKKNSSL